MTEAHLLEDGNRPQPRGRLSSGTISGLEDVLERIGAAATARRLFVGCVPDSHANPLQGIPNRTYRSGSTH
jgi:hypothetical protein